MITEFDRIPDLFVDRYDAVLKFWATNFRAKGPVLTVTLQGPVAGVPAVDEHGQTPFIAVTLRAERRGGGMLVKPLDEQSADLIARHVAALRH